MKGFYKMIYLYTVQALDALSEAEKHDPGSIHTQFSLYKLALAESDVENGLYQDKSQHDYQWCINIRRCGMLAYKTTNYPPETK